MCRRAKPRSEPRRRPRSELPLHHPRSGRMGVWAPDLPSSSPSRKPEPRQHLRGPSPRRTRGVRRALRAAPRSPVPSSWEVVAHTAVPPHAKSHVAPCVAPASALAAVAPARMGFTPVGLLCGTAAEVAPHPRRAVSTQAKSIERSRRRPWKPTRARSEAWLRESKNCSRESTSSLAAERSSRAPGPALPLVLLPSRLLRARYRRGRRCRCARTCMFTYPHAPCGLCLLAYRVYSP
jgi:hypothetical protein